MFSGCAVPPDSKEAKLGSRDQEASASVGKNVVAMLILCYTWKYVSMATSSGMDIPKVTGCFLLQQTSSQ